MHEQEKEDELQMALGAAVGFGRAVVSARSNTDVFVVALKGFPNVSQRFNASKAEVLDAVAITLATMDAASSFIADLARRYNYRPPEPNETASASE